jgi:hypothetical protein
LNARENVGSGLEHEAQRLGVKLYSHGPQVEQWEIPKDGMDPKPQEKK